MNTEAVRAQDTKARKALSPIPPPKNEDPGTEKEKDIFSITYQCHVQGALYQL